MGHSMRTERYRFTRWHPTKSPNKTVAVELYDLVPDRVERENIAARSKNAALINELTAKLTAGWRGALPESANQFQLQPQHHP
jgi:hypothetical protein